MADGQTQTAAVLQKYENDLLADWSGERQVAGSSTNGRVTESELRAQLQEFLSLLHQAAQSGHTDSTGPEWDAVNGFLEDISLTRLSQGFTTEQTASFIFSFKKPLFKRL